MPWQGDQPDARDTAALYERLDRALERIGLETQPEVATRILDLAGDPDAGPADFARVIRNDAGITGRLLRIANSAYFAQRDGVSSVARACVVLGLERTKAIALGFYLARSAGSGENSALARRVWGQSLFRACLASELARPVVPNRTAEAFVIGLMLDCGVALMPRLVGEGYHALLDDAPTPARLLYREIERFGCSHADVAAVLVRRWKLPEILARPIEWRHVPPDSGESGAPTGELQRLQRIAYYAGAIALCPETGGARQPAPMPGAAERLLGFGEEKLVDALARATREYEVTSGVFGEFAELCDDPEALAAGAHVALNRVIERTLVTGSDPSLDPRRGVYSFEGNEVELRSNGVDLHVAVLRTPDGEEIVSYRFVAAIENAEDLLVALGVEPSPGPELERLRAELARLAA